MSSMPNQDTVLHNKQSTLACRGQLANGMLIKPALLQHYAQLGVLLDESTRKILSENGGNH